VAEVLPRAVKKVLALLEGDPARRRGLAELAAAAGVAPRTLQKHFRRFLDRTPQAVQHDLRLDRARQELLRGAPDAAVTDIALRCGFRHLGRFSVLYRGRYGESPSATLRARRAVAARESSVAVVRIVGERPTIGVLPLEPAGGAIAQEIEAALCRCRWLSLRPPEAAQYRLRAALAADGGGRLRLRVMLLEAASGRYLWADRWHGEEEDRFAFEERVAAEAARAIERAVREAEIERARRASPESLGAWSLTMRAMPHALRVEPTEQALAIELLDRAIELAPADPLPVAFAAWCRGQRGGHRFTACPDVERAKARELAAKAARLNAGDPVVEALVGAALTLAHDLDPAARHFEQALQLDGACVWAWNRSGWIGVYRGQADEAIERFRIARTIAPDDPLNFFCTLGIAAAHFEAARYAEAADWFDRALAEHPAAVWVNRFRAPALALADRKEEARHSLAALLRLQPDLTLSEIRAALPNTPGFLDRQAEGLEAAGLRV
jgi:AraC-like DNA-binding protein/tetratricopeptide (TPR) repeat protein